MRLKGFLMLIVGISLLGSGCATFRFAPSPPPNFKVKYSPENYETDVSKYNQETSIDGRTKYRDKIVYSIANEVDKNYVAFRNAFFAQRAGAETLLDITQIGLTSAGTLAAGQTTKAILAAIATGVTGSRLSFNKNFFKEKSPDLLISRMDALRAKQWSMISLKLMNSKDNTYPLAAADRDLVAYYLAGSLQSAFEDIIAESGATQKAAEDNIQQQIEKKYGGRMGRMASESELQEIKRLFQSFLASKNISGQAEKVLENFKTPPDTPMNPDTKASYLDNVKYLYSLAIRENYPEVRKALTQAFIKASIGN